MSDRTELVDAARQGNLELVQKLVERHGVDGVNEALFSAITGGHLPVVQWLVERNNNAHVVLNSTNNKGLTPLHWACYQKKYSIVHYLLKHGANANAQNEENMQTTLYLAVMGYNNDAPRLAIVQCLVEYGANVHAQYQYQNTCLHTAAQNGHFSVAQYLIEQGGADAHAQNQFQQTPLHLACACGAHGPMVQYLVEQAGADIHVSDRDGMTPLRWAVFSVTRPNMAVIHCLVRNGADLTGADRSGRTAIQIAIDQNDREDVVQYLQGMHQLRQCHSLVLYLVHEIGFWNSETMGHTKRALHR